MRIRLIVCILANILFLLSACGPTPQIRSDKYLKDTSVITGEPCGAPCWRDIIPGETPWSDAIIIIEDDVTLVDLETQTDENSERIGAAWGQLDGELCCQMFSDDGETVSFIILQTTPESNLEALFAEHGEPNYVIGESLSDNQGIFSLFYTDIPMLVYAFIEGEGGSVSATSEVVGFAYMTEDLMDLLVNTADPGLHEWEGYQTYAAYMDSELEITPSITLTPTREG